LNRKSLKFRFAVSVLGNGLRGLLQFLTILILARGLGPENYGHYSFLIGSFVAVRALLDLGTNEAFFTFLSKKKQKAGFIHAYVAWLGIQFFLSLLLIGWWIPEPWFTKIWLGLDRDLVLIAFTVVFLQHQVWITLVRIGESERLTHYVQALNISLALTNLSLMGLLFLLGSLTLPLVFLLMAAEYLVAVGVAWKLFGVDRFPPGAVDRKKMFQDYLQYCSPLVIYNILQFGYEFADRWLLQNFGGPEQQGFFAVGFQFAAVSLVLSASMLNLFWKEIAEALEQGNAQRVKHLYHRVARFLVMLSAAISGLLIPWSSEIVQGILGPKYVESAPVLAIMFLYPIHQSIGLIDVTLFMAAGHTRTFLIHGAVFMAVSIPIAYWVQAPADAPIPGLELGALGMALKLVVLQFFQSNARTWWNARVHNWRFDWPHQFAAIGSALGLGALACQAARAVGGGEPGAFPILPMGLSLLIYGGLIAGWFWLFPGLLGYTREELKNLLNQLVIFPLTRFIRNG